MGGVDFLPGVNVTSNMSDIKIWSDYSLAAFDYSVRMAGKAYYQINLTQPADAVGFDIVNWETDPPTDAGSVDYGLVEIFLEGGSSHSFGLSQIPYTDTIPPVFFGVITDGGPRITKIVWYEAHEGATWGGGNEETSLDNFYVGRRATVPEPTLTYLLASGLIALAGIRKKLK